MKTYLYNKLSKLIFKKAFWFYRPAYTLYRRISERNEFKLLRNLLKEGDRVIDIGANIGVYSSFFSKCVGKFGSVYAFEPEERNFNHLKESVQNKKNVFSKKVAVSDHCGEVQLYLSNDLSIDHRTYPVDARKKSVTVESVTIDSLFKHQKVRCIKIDIQGYEYTALKGMSSTLKENSDIFVIMKLWPYGLLLAGSQPSDIEKFFAKLGFSLYMKTDGHFFPYNSSLLKTDKHTSYSLLAQKSKK